MSAWTWDMVPGLSWGNTSGGRGLLCLLPVLSLECPFTAVEGYVCPSSVHENRVLSFQTEVLCFYG